MDYNSRLKSLRTDRNYAIDEIKELDKREVEELKETRRLIEEKYSNLKQKPFSDLDRKTTELYNYCKLIEKYSTMDSKIFHIITELISIFEGENYVLERINYHKDKSTPSAVWETFLIIPKSIFKNIKNPNYVREQYFNHLLKNGLAIKIVEEWSSFYLPDYFSFYKVDSTGRLEQQINFKGFPYLKQFIDYIINYRIENNIEELSEEEMQTLKDKFILLNFDNIQNNYQLKKEQRIKETIENINFECEHNQKILRRIVKKIKENK